MFKKIWNKFKDAKDIQVVFEFTKKYYNLVITAGMSILTFIGECFDGRTFGEATIMVFIVAYLCYGFIYFVENCKMNKKIKNAKLQWAKNKKINNEELKRKQEDIDIELNKEREQKIDDILIQAISSENSIVLYKQCMILARGMPEYKKKITEDTARQICGENATEEQKSTIYTLLDMYEADRLLEIEVATHQAKIEVLNELIEEQKKLPTEEDIINCAKYIIHTEKRIIQTVKPIVLHLQEQGFSTENLDIAKILLETKQFQRGYFSKIWKMKQPNMILFYIQRKVKIFTNFVLGFFQKYLPKLYKLSK